MNRPADDAAAAGNANTNRAATSNNGGAASGVATLETLPSPSATTIIMDSSTPLSVSERPTDLPDGGNDNNAAAVANANTDTAPATINDGAAPGATRTTNKADVSKKGTILIHHVNRAAAKLRTLEEEEKNANAARERDTDFEISSPSERGENTSAKSTENIMEPNPQTISRDKQRSRKQGEEAMQKSAIGEQKMWETVQDTNTDFVGRGDEGSPPNPKLADDGKDLAPSTAKGGATLDANSGMTKVGQDLHGDDKAPPPSSKVEVIEDKDGPSIPPGMSAMPLDGDSTKFSAVRTAVSRKIEKQAKACPENIQDDTGPVLPLCMMEFTDLEKIKPTVRDPPRPFNSEDSLVIPTSEEMEGEVAQVHSNRRGIVNDVTTNATSVAQSNSGVHRDEDEEANVQYSIPENMSSRPDLERDSTFKVPEAVLVEDNADAEVYMGTPIVPPLPWWKLKQVRMALICVMAIAVAIALAIALPSDNSETVIIVTNTISNAPSTSTFPSVKPSGAPSVLPSSDPSPEPSSHPSACVTKIVSNMQNISLPLDDPQDPAVAVDEKNMVVVVRNGDRFDRNPAFVIFHSLEAGAGWLSADSFVIDDLADQDWYSVALSGKTAFVGFDEANGRVGTVLVFEQNQSGYWEKMKDPFVHVSASSHFRFGKSVGVDGDLAFVDSPEHVYLFSRESNGTWVEFDRVDSVGSDHAVSGDTIAIENIQLYKYTADLNQVVTIQDPIPTGNVRSMDLSNDYLVYWDEDEKDAFVYRREESNQTFAFHQQLNVSGPGYNQLALDIDSLVVGGIDSTRIFSEQNGNWEETITLDRQYAYYALSGMQLIASTNSEVHSFDIQDCAPEIPTQTPSSSQMPTSYPTTLPSMSLLPSIVPSSSISPTETCYWIAIAIDHDDKPKDTYWKLWRVGDRWEEVKRHQASKGDTSYYNLICLQEGEYQFKIFDKPGEDGICCDNGEGHYNVTSNGALIVDGGKFEFAERTSFSLPFVPGTSKTFNTQSSGRA